MDNTGDSGKQGKTEGEKDKAREMAKAMKQKNMASPP